MFLSLHKFLLYKLYFSGFSIETGSTVGSKGQPCADHRVIDQSISYLHGSCKFLHRPQIWSV